MNSNKVEPIAETVTVLITALSDKETVVNDVVIKSLFKIAGTYPNEVIEIFCDFYKNTPKVNSVQLANVIKVLEQTCVNHVKKLQPETVGVLLATILHAMTQNTEYEPTVQMAASSVLVALGHVYLDMVLRTLINETNTNAVPHYTIPHTLGTLAAVNTHDTVPHIKEILGKMLPLLPLVKVEGTKQAFAYAFGHFAVAVSEQIGDNVENDNITAIKENFVVEFSLIFDVLYNQWLHTHEPRVTESVLEALGPITRLISERKFDETVNKFVLSLLALYKKTAINPYYVSQCISYLLTLSPLNPKLSLNDNVINSLNHILFTLVLLEPDYDQPHTVKNHFEVLRCFDHLAGQFPDPTIEGLLHHCKSNNEKERMKAVIVLTHLTTSSQMFIEKFSTKFIAILKVMTTMEQSLKMKKLLVKAIVGLAYRNCISSVEDFTMVEFIVKNCGYEAGPNVAKDEVFELQDTCRSSLIIMCNTVVSVRTQLHTLLLQSLTLEDFTLSMTTVAHCLTTLLQNNSAAPSEDQDATSQPQVSPELVFVRCIIYLVDRDEVERNKNLLMFLEEYSGDVHKNLKNEWTIEIQRLLKYVDRKASTEEWQGMLLNLLVLAIEQVNNNKWTENISVALSNQILKTKQPTIIKGMSLQYLAIVSCHLSNAAIVENVLKIILFSLKAIPIESCEYVSKAVGIASRRHGEYVLNELDLIHKDIEGKRSSKILNFLSSKHSKTDAELNIVKYAVITCYGKVAVECFDVHVLARLAENVTNILYEILKCNPHIDLCKVSITTLYQICKALQPAAHHNIVLRNRWQLLTTVLDQIQSTNLDKRNIEIYPTVVKAVKALTKLQKGAVPEERNTILKIIFGTIFGELQSYNKMNEAEDNKTNMRAKILNDSLVLVHGLVRELIVQSTCLSTVDDLMSLLVQWLCHDDSEIRMAIVLLLQVIFETYIKNVKINYESPSKFGQMGYLLGIVMPGVADTNFQVRQITVDCIKLIIQIQDLYEGHIVDPEDECMKALASFHNDILTNDLTMIRDYCQSLCEKIYEKIPHQYTMQFVESLLESFDNHEYRSTGISAILNALFVKIGQDMYQNIERILEAILDTMMRVPEHQQKLLPCVTSLARHHSNAVTAVLLGQKIPLKDCVVSVWRHLARDRQLASFIVDNFLRVMTSTELFEDPYHVTDHHVAALQPLTLITALGEMLEEESTSELCNVKFAELFAVLFTTFACYIDAEPPAYSIPADKTRERFGFVPNRDALKLSPAKIAMDTFSSFLLRAGCHKVREACSLWLSVEPGALTELVGAAVGALLREQPARLPSVSTALAAHALSPLPPQRCAVLAFFGEMVTYRCNDNAVLIETVMSTLLSGCKDASSGVRACSLRGIANVAQLPKDLLSHYLPAALNALSQGVDAPTSSILQDNVPLAAIQGLIRLLTETEKLSKEFDRELLSLSQKIRPFMNTDCATMRENSIALFGVLAGIVDSESLEEQAMSSLPCFLLHLCDSNAAVIRASKFTLKRVFKTFHVKKANEMVQNHLLDEARLVIEQFLPALLRQLAEEAPQRVTILVRSTSHYLHSVRDDIRPYPPLLLATLYAELHRFQNSTEHPRPDLEPDVSRSARNRLMQLMKDPNPTVREYSAMALANICLYQAAELEMLSRDQ